MKARIAPAFALALGLFAQAAGAGDQEWSDISPPVPVDHLAASPAASGLLYAASSTDGVYVSADSGATWTERNAGLTITAITAIAAAPGDPDRVVAAEAAGQLVVSNDRGASWSAGPSGAVSFVTRIVFDPVDDDVVYALDDGTGSVRKSVDGGATWTNHTAGLPPSAGLGDNTDLVIVPLDAQTLYAATADGVFISEDAGETWSSAQGPELPSTEIVKLAEHPSEPDTVAGLFVVGDSVQFWRTNNRGEQWYRPGEDPVAKFRAQSVTVDPADPSRLLLGGGNGVFGSVDAAHHWVDLSNGLSPDVSPDDRTVTAVAFDPNITRRYYAASGGELQIYDGLLAMDLIVSATRTPPRVDPDDEVSVEFAVANITGEPLDEASFTVEIPEGFTLDSFTFDGVDCTDSAQALDCTIDDLAPGADVAGSLIAIAGDTDGLYEFRVSADHALREATPDSNVVELAVRIGETPEGEDPDNPGEPLPEPPAPPPPRPQPEPSDPRPDQPGRTGGGGGHGGWLLLLAAVPLVRRAGRR